MHKNHSPRLLIALVTLFYGWLSLATPFQHRDCFVHEMEASLQGVTTTRFAAAPLHTHVTKQTQATRILDCVACEWQAVNVSPALAAFQVPPPPPIADGADVLFPSYVRLLSFPSSSRAPPVA